MFIGTKMVVIAVAGDQRFLSVAAQRKSDAMKMGVK